MTRAELERSGKFSALLVVKQIKKEKKNSDTQMTYRFAFEFGFALRLTFDENEKESLEGECSFFYFVICSVGLVGKIFCT